MPIHNGIGHSQTATPDKQAGLDALLRQHIQIVKAVLNRHPYFPQTYVYIDTNAGDGCNPNENCDGSPIVFLNVAARSGVEYSAHFIDIEIGNTRNLQAAVSGYNHHRIYTGDNSRCVPQILSFLDKNTYGLIYSDPTGIPDFNMLAVASGICSKLDILVRYSATSAKRNRRHLIDDLKQIKKETWLVRALNPSDKFQWTFLFGTNYTDYKPWRKYGFFRMDEPDGAEEFTKITYTREELSERLQMSLLDSPRNQAIKRSGGLCERCHKNPVTEPHHLRYGPGITADDIIAVCHKCHCELEGKAN